MTWLMPAEDAYVARLLDATRRHLGMELAWISRIEDGQQVVETTNGDAESFGVMPGTRSDWETSYCSRVLGGEHAGVVTDARSDPRTANLPITSDLGIGAYVGAPVRLADNVLYGMLCCFSHQKDPTLQQRDADFVAVIAELLGEVMQSRRDKALARRETTDRITAVLLQNQIPMVFQPVFAATDDRLTGYEALARLPLAHGTPDRWFADAAKVGLGVELELAAVRAALNAFTDRPPQLVLGVNASADLICDRRLYHLLAEHPTIRVVLELTEHNKVSDWTALRSAIVRLRELRVVIAADDAGAGYAGLQHLVELRPDAIKLDIAIIRNIDHDLARKAMATAVIGFANTIGAVVLAEGVETQGELDTVKALGAHRVQGYYVGRPGPLPRMTAPIRHSLGPTTIPAPARPADRSPQPSH